MRIKIGALRANPYRRIEHYPISQDKVDGLKESIEATEFWDNIVVRKSTFKKGEFEIAYGHHRLHALRDLFEPSHEVDLPVRKISDERMLQIMARENSDTWKSDASVMAETVHAALEAFAGGETPTLKSSSRGVPLSTYGIIQPHGAEFAPSESDLATFLAMTRHDVSTALEILALSARIPDVEPETFANVPERRAREFVRHDKKLKKTKLTQKAQDTEMRGFIKKHTTGPSPSTHKEIEKDSDRFLKQATKREEKAERPVRKVAGSLSAEVDRFMRMDGYEWQVIEALAAHYPELTGLDRSRCDSLAGSLRDAAERATELADILAKGEAGALKPVKAAQTKLLEAYHD